MERIALKELHEAAVRLLEKHGADHVQLHASGQGFAFKAWHSPVMPYTNGGRVVKRGRIKKVG